MTPSIPAEHCCGAQELQRATEPEPQAGDDGCGEGCCPCAQAAGRGVLPALDRSGEAASPSFAQEGARLERALPAGGAARAVAPGRPGGRAHGPPLFVLNCALLC